ncbi:hypothetical protein NFI96_012339 [Prochilodus magdalenae]|nr:hypothetical protein NFI96_012339 [Prochilodus magdalenae]
MVRPCPPFLEVGILLPQSNYGPQLQMTDQRPSSKATLHIHQPGFGPHLHFDFFIYSYFGCSFEGEKCIHEKGLSTDVSNCNFVEHYMPMLT